MAKVHARFLCLNRGTAGVDPLVDKLLEAEDVELIDNYNRARDIYISDIKRSYVESCLLASQNLDQISTLVEIPAPVLRMYRSMFFEVTGMDKLSLLEVVDNTKDSTEKGMKLWAMSQGLDFIAWRLGKSVTLNPVDGLQELFTLSVFKSKEALFSGNIAESSKEATKWTKLSMDLARLLKAWVMDSDAAKTDIEIALKSIEPEFEGFDTLGSLDDLLPGK